MRLMDRPEKLAEAVKRPELRGRRKRMLEKRMRAVRFSREQQDRQRRLLEKELELEKEMGDKHRLTDAQLQLILLDQQIKKILLRERAYFEAAERSPIV